MPLINNVQHNKINHSASFVISNNYLDKCPKCGQNVCEHTSVADAINLHNSVSQDFSTYSSDSSLIKQLFNEPTCPKNMNKSNRISMSAINKFNESFFVNQYQKQQHLRTCKECNCNQMCKNFNQKDSSITNSNSFMPCFTLRPLSCQVMIIDNETTDRLLKDFFDASSTSPYQACMNSKNHRLSSITTSVLPEICNEKSDDCTETENNKNELPWHSSPKNEISNSNSIKLVEDLNRINKGKEKTQKKKKFSNFRLFLKNSSINKTDFNNKSSPNKKAILKSSGLVNCLTSSTSSSSSSCEELRHKLFTNKSNNSKTKKPSKYYRQAKPIDENEKDKTLKSKRQNSDNSTTDNDQTVLYEESNELTSTDHSNSTLKFAPHDMNEEIEKNRNDSKISLCKSIISLNSKTINYNEEEEEVEEDDNDNHDYNEMENIELCPIVVSDIDEYQEDNQFKEDNSNKSSKNNTSRKSNTTKFKNCNNNYNSNNFNNNNIINNHNNTTNINNISTIISVPLNNYLFYNYEKRNDDKEDENINLKTNATKTKNSSKIFNKSCGSTADSNNSTELTDLNPRIDNSSSFNTIKTTNSFIRHSEQIYITKPDTINSDKLINSQSCYAAMRTNEAVNKKNRKEPISKNRLSYFSSCSSTCEESSGTFDEITKTDCLSENPLNETGTTDSDFTLHKYHSISIVFIIIGLFSINFFQEYFVLFYYFNTEQFYWLIYSMIALFTGQTVTLILSLLTEIDLISYSANTSDISEKNPAVNTVFSPSSISSSSLPLSKEKYLKNDETNNGTLLTNQSYKNQDHQTDASNEQKESILSNKKEIFDNDLYVVFKNPFSKVFLLIPGYLPICVYIQFFKHVFNYKKSPGNTRFKLEFQLSLYLFYNGIFHSLPLAIINSCYFASTTTSYSLSSYYTELLSIFSIASSTSTSSTTAIFVDDLNMERRNQLVLLIVSIFISISIGICLFTTYFELMKQMNYLSFLKYKTGFYNYTGLSMFSNSSSKSMRHKNNQNNHTIIDFKYNNLGLIEILVYFCYKFCLITSRLSIIAIFWYLFQEWLIVAILAHILFSYFSSYFCSCIKNNKKVIKNQNESNENMLKRNTNNTDLKEKNNTFKIRDFDLIVDSSLSSTMTSNEQVSKLENAAFKGKRSKLNKQLTLFIICFLSFIDLFMNQLSEIYHIKKVVVYYVLYFLQNFSVLTYWLIKSIMSARSQFQQANESSNLSTTSSSTTQSDNEIYQNRNNNFLFILKSFTTVSSNLKSGAEVFTKFSPTQYACYATLIYLFIMLFTIFGLILKFLHLHILRKRYRKLYN